MECRYSGARRGIGSLRGIGGLLGVYWGLEGSVDTHRLEGVHVARGTLGSPRGVGPLGGIRGCQGVLGLVGSVGDQGPEGI